MDYYYFTLLYFKEIATLTAISASGGMVYCSVSIGRHEDMILQAGTLDQAPIIHQVTSSSQALPSMPPLVAACHVTTYDSNLSTAG